MKLLEELKYYLKMFFKHSYGDVFFRDNKIMKMGVGGGRKFSFTEDLKIHIKKICRVSVFMTNT